MRDRKNRGLCSNCGNATEINPKTGKHYSACPIHKKSKAANQKARRKRLYQSGLCVTCQKPNKEDTKNCKECLDKVKHDLRIGLGAGYDFVNEGLIRFDNFCAGLHAVFVLVPSPKVGFLCGGQAPNFRELIQICFNHGSPSEPQAVFNLVVGLAILIYSPLQKASLPELVTRLDYFFYFLCN